MKKAFQRIYSDQSERGSNKRGVIAISIAVLLIGVAMAIGQKSLWPIPAVVSIAATWIVIFWAAERLSKYRKKSKMDRLMRDPEFRKYIEGSSEK